jgi:hypothetical protein
MFKRKKLPKQKKTPEQYLAEAYARLEEYDTYGKIQGRPSIRRADILDLIQTTEDFIRKENNGNKTPSSGK